MDMSVGLSVILITMNRAESLRRTLNGYTELVPPSIAWEVLVVDNNSTDQTRQVVESFADRLPIRYQLCTQRGTCEARNCGIRHSRYPFTVFTDDDITVSRDWLVAYVRAFQVHPEASYFGGPIELDLSACSAPAWMLDRPGHLHDWLGGQLGEFNAAQIARIGLSTPDAETWLFYAANMGCYKRLFDRYGLFEPQLGLTGTRRYAAEEPYMHQRMYAAGERPYYIPEAVVYHRIRQDEVTFRSRWRWATWRGRGAAVMDYLSGVEQRVSWWRLRRHLKGTLRQLPALAARDRFTQLRALCELTMIWNYEMQMIQLLRHDLRSEGL